MGTFHRQTVFYPLTITEKKYMYKLFFSWGTKLSPQSEGFQIG